MDKSREQFEAAIKQKYGDLIDQGVCKNGDGEYMAWDMQVAWWAWQASRAAVEIEIPEVLDYWLGREGFAESIRAAGLKVKGE
ncbi:hypothetical protein VWS48_002924 [Cronobacter sakazakii]|uniref:hypothetical protein n=1 Tax=Cronobacter sakazakii TaxID=28141 RepID=UPI001A32CF35|nr:hypothetical protein [Cronobacter sakazakii]ELY4140549.1 hypothetical protein [Cronobacter sakazakii]ELY4514291.1 hypothetical protein [Cronobacter sakazakii]ELY5834507.1 hypothetical protein [Cronobacter sakazakii]EMC4349317.1 hypothetical protein [Cronobacter sakazakii]